MSRCYNCKNNRRQLLSLNCKHDTCIRCAADNYFLNCKNKVSAKGSSQNNYFCETCLEQTPLDLSTLQQLKKYFMENIIIQEKHKQNRKEKLQQKEAQQKQRLQRLQRLDAQGSLRPKSLEIEMDQRKRNLSKYLNDKQVEKFIEMQKEYGVSKRDRHHKEDKVQPQPAKQRATPQSHTLETSHNNQYELKNTKQYQALKRRDNANMVKQKYSDTDSFDRFADHQQLKNQYARIKDYQNKKLKTQHHDQQQLRRQQQEEYELYHNGKAIPNYNPKTANRILHQGKISQNGKASQNGKVSEQGSKSRYSSSSSNRAIGKIKTKRIMNQTQSNQASMSPVIGKDQRDYLQKLNGQRRNERLMSAQSQENAQGASYQAYQTKAVSIEYHYKNNSNSVEWQLQSRSTRRANQEKTVALADRHSQTMEQILQTLQHSQIKKEPTHKGKEQLQKGKERPTDSPKDNQQQPKEEEKEKLESYFCKIHEDEEIIYFCLKCSQLICSECALHGAHKQHEIHSLKKSAQLLRQNIVHNMSTLNKMLIEEETKEKVLKECINELSLECSRQKEQVKSSFQNFIFAVDKRYKDLLKQIQDKFSTTLTEYNQKLAESRNTYILISQIKDDVSDTLQDCTFQEDQPLPPNHPTTAPASNQLGNFHIKKHKQKANHNQHGIQHINKLINTISELSDFLKNSKETFFSPKKGSLISEPSSLKLSDSSNLLQDRGQYRGQYGQERGEFDFVTTPTTNTPQRSANQTPKRRSKRIVDGGHGLSIKNRIKLCRCQSIVQSLMQMQQIVRAIKLDAVQYQVRALS